MFLLLSAGIITGGILFYRGQAQRTRQQQELILESIAQLKMDQIVNWRNERLDDGKMLAHSPVFATALAAWLAHPQAAETDRLLASLFGVDGARAYYNTLLLDKAGRVLMVTRPDRLAGVCDDTQRLLDAALQSGEVILSDFYRCNPDEFIHLDLIVPLQIQQGVQAEPIDGMILQILPTDFLYPLIQSWPVPSQTSETLLIRREGNQVVFLNELRYRTNTALVFKLPLADPQLPAAIAALGKEGTVEGHDYRGRQVLAVVRQVPDSPWALVAKTDTDEVFASLRTLAIAFIIAVILLIVLAGAGVGLIFSAQGRAFYQQLYRAEAARQEERGRLLDEVERKNKELESIIYVASHDLRSPLVNIQGFSQRLQKSSGELVRLLTQPDVPETLRLAAAPILEERIPTALHFIQASSAKMDGLINGLLRLSRVGRVVLSPAQLDMNGMFEAILATLAFQLEKASAAVDVESLPSCWGDGGQINQVFSNLLDNALKYRDPDRSLRIRVTGRVEGGKAVYTVADTGRGIPLDHQERIWEVFHRLDPQGSAPGEGLGLALVRRIVERHHGRIWVESAPGRGSAFFVELPTKP
ncbi:MAG: ATP-binding protein [Chloroflexi bacterium]|nr:ATP-binding protein [Chloroflexota bacterium]